MQAKINQSRINKYSSKDLLVKLEKAQETVQKLGKRLGVTIVSDSSSSNSEGDVSDVSHEAEQMDFEFAATHTYTTNVTKESIFV